MKNKIISLAAALMMTVCCLVSCGGSSESQTDVSRSESSVSTETTTLSHNSSEPVTSSQSESETTTVTTTSETSSTPQRSTTSDETTSETASAPEKATTVKTTSPTQKLPAQTTTTAKAHTQSTAATKKPAPAEPALAYAKAAVLYCADDDSYLYSRNLNSKISIASTTKLLTASLALKYLSPNKIITVGSEVWFTKPDSTVAGLRVGQKLTTEQLLYGLLLPSGNDAAYTVAVNVARAANPGQTLSDSRAVSTFAAMMNAFAAQLHMTSSHFANPEGWDDAMHYSTLSDMIKLTRYALSQPVISKIVSTHYKSVKLASGGYLSWTNTNSLIDPNSPYYLSAANGVKTGTTANAGYCLIASVKYGAKTYYCAAMGCRTTYDRYRLVRSLVQKYLNRSGSAAA